MERPFRTAFGEELFPSIERKASALFHSLICNHCFLNGNKRVAVLALDGFLALNDLALMMPTLEIYELSKDTARANSEGRRVEDVLNNLAVQIGTNCCSVGDLSHKVIAGELSEPRSSQAVAVMFAATISLMEKLSTTFSS